MVDPISDMLTRIRNAQAVGHKSIDLSFSRIKSELADILHSNGYIGNVSKKGKGKQKEIEIILKYKDGKDKIPLIQGLKRISKPSQKFYVNKKKLWQFSKERGVVVLSTSQGLMTSKEAKQKGIGGEVLCIVW